MMKEFSEKYPAVQFTLYNETVDSIKERLDKGLVDIGLLLEPIDVTKYDYIRLDRQDTWGLLVREDHPLAEKASLTAQDVASCPLLLPLRETSGWRFCTGWAVRKRNCASRCFTRCFPTRPAGGGKAWLCLLYGWSAGYPQRPAPAFYPAGAAPDDAQCAGVEEE